MGYTEWRKRDSPEAPTVEAVQLTKENVREVAEWCTGKEITEIDSLDPDKKYVGLNFLSWEGMTRAHEGDYIIKDSLGQFTWRWPENFEQSFEEVTDA